jgi:hypothetical protein
MHSFIFNHVPACEIDTHCGTQILPRSESTRKFLLGHHLLVHINGRVSPVEIFDYLEGLVLNDLKYFLCGLAQIYNVLAP